MAGDCNMNLLDIEENNKVRSFVNIVFGNSMMAIINKLTCVTKKTATAIDHIFINPDTTSKFKIGIIKSDVSDYFPIFFLADCNINIKGTKPCYIFRCNLFDISVQSIKYKLCLVNADSDSVTNSSNTSNAYNSFTEIFSSLYEECFPKNKIKFKTQKYNNPSITKGIKKSSKITQKLCKKKLYKSY